MDSPIVTVSNEMNIGLAGSWVLHGLASRKLLYLLSDCRNEWTSKWTVTISDS